LCRWLLADTASGPPSDLIGRYQELFLDGVIDGVALVAADSNACAACLAVTDKVYLPSALPKLPIDGCTHPSGCRCRYEPNVMVPE
jgi:hypothetical protein